MVNNDSWHLSKGLTIGVICGLLFNAGSFLWYASKIDSRVSQNESAIVFLNSITSETNKQLSDINIKLTRIKTILEFSDIQRELSSFNNL